MTSGKIKWNVGSGERLMPDLDDPDAGAFWRAVQDHRLTYLTCRQCGGIVFYPRAHCTHCLSEELDERESAGEGSVYSYTVIHRNPDPAFAGMTPYVVGLVDLAEGFRMLTHLRVDPEVVRVGQPVRVEWDTVDGYTLPVFAPLDSTVPA